MATAHTPGEKVLVHIGKRLQKNCTKLTKGRWHCQLCGITAIEDENHQLLSEKDASQISLKHSSPGNLWKAGTV